MTKRLILGVDPGISGAFALYDPDANALAFVADVPTHKVQINSSPRNVQDIWAISRTIDMHAASIRLAVIEEPHAMPAQGVASAFTFGRALGEFVGIVAANFIRIEFVRPAVWKRAMGLSHDKDQSRRQATKMWPQHGNLFERRKDDGRAEAALLAVYGKKVAA